MNIYLLSYLTGIVLFWCYVGILFQYSRITTRIPNLPLGKLFCTDYAIMGFGDERAQNIVAYHGVGVGTVVTSIFWPFVVLFHILKVLFILMIHTGKFLTFIVRKIIWLLLPKETKMSIALGTQKQDD